MKMKINEHKVIEDARHSDLDVSDKNGLHLALQRGMSRREALFMMAAAGLSMAAADNLVNTAIGAIATTPKKGGLIKFASDLHGPNDQMDPALFAGGIDYTRGRATYNSLIQHANDLTPLPELAEEFSSNADATEWTFKIRKGVVFHDGTPLTADDVIWSMNRHLGEKSTSTVKAVVSSIKEWKKIDSHTAKAILTTSFADLPTVLGMFQFKIVKKDTVDFKKGIGTGPYVMESFKPGVGSTHLRNENYWRESAYLDAIEIFAITDSLARVNALVSDDIQLAQAVDPKAIRQIEDAPGVEVLSVPGGSYMAIAIMKNTLPGSNDDFVKGMQYIQRRERIVKSILKGHGTIGNDQPINAAYGDGFCSEIPQRSFDPDKAKFHFKKAGVNSAEIFVADVIAGISDTVLLAQAELMKIGFKLDVKKVPNDGYWGAVYLKTPINVTMWNMRPTVNSMMSITFAPDAAWNDSQWKNERMGELLILSRSETNAQKRHAMLCEMQTLVYEKSGMVIPAHPNYIDGKSSKVHGMPTVPLGRLGAFEWPEFAWLEA